MSEHDGLPDLDIDADAIEREASGEQTAAATLANVQSGGAVLVGLTQARLTEALAAVKEGRFNDAANRVQEALGKVQALQAAEYSLATFAGKARIIRVVEVWEGAMVLGIGRVTKREEFRVQHQAGNDCLHVRLHFEDGDEVEYNSQRELLVEREDNSDTA